MRFVAEYVMRGRNQALWVAVLGASSLMFAWISASVLALVTLRRGPLEGLYILVWALLPAGFLLAVFGDIGPISMIVGTTALASILRWTVSWPLTLCASSLFGAVTGLGMLWFGVSYLQQLADIFAQVFAGFEEQLAQQSGKPVTLQPPGIGTIAGMLGLLNGISCVLCLLLARWWQSGLYNPGGFRSEFHGLRLSPAISAVLVLITLSIGTMGLEYRPWAVLFALPLSVAGLGLIHARAAYKGFGAGYLTLFYLLWIFLDPVKLIVVGLALVDSWIDFRSRWRKPSKDPSEKDDDDSDNE